MSLFDVGSQAQTFVTSKLINPNNVGGGTTVPFQQTGTTRVPVVTGLRLGASTSYTGGTQYTLLFDEPLPGSNVSHYNVFIVGALSNNQSPLGPFAAEHSPIYLRLVTSTNSVLTFYVQTVLSNGTVSSLSDSPSVTSLSVSPAVNPSGTAGGDLAGDYPNPILVVLGAFAGTYGDATHTPRVTVDNKGRVTGVTSVAITGSSPGGAASGDLSGTYPGPTVSKVNNGSIPVSAVVAATNASNQIIAAVLSADEIWVGSGSNLPAAVALSGDITLVSSGLTTLKNTGPGAGTYVTGLKLTGGGTNGSITIDAKGRVTAITPAS